MGNNAFKGPLSGDVSQVINPWQWWNSQLGNNSASLINITQYKSSAPEVEAEIVQDVAGYGMQLGKIIEVLTVVLDALPVEKLPTQRQEIITDFHTMAKQITEVKQEKRLRQVCPAGIDQFIAGLKQLQQDDPEMYKHTVKKLEAALREEK